MPDTKAPAHTRDPLPADAPTSMPIGRCPICRAGTMMSGDGPHGLATPTTRSIDPGPDGRHELHPHEPWCPVWTGETPEVPCPRCGAPVMGVEYEPGYEYTDPHGGPFGGPGTLVGTMSEISNRPLVYGVRIDPDPRFDRAIVQPCGHEFRGDAIPDPPVPEPSVR